MKKHLLLFLFSNTIIKFALAQILCVQCFQQNDSIGINVGSNNLIMNGGFENTTCATACAGVYCPNSATYNCSIANWTCTGGGTSTYGCVYDSANYFVVQGTRAVYFGNSYSNPCSGTSASTFPNNDTSCLNHLTCTITGIPSGFPLSGPNYGDTAGLSISQTVSGLTIGSNYVLEFWAGGEYEGWFSKKGMFAVDVGFGNIFLSDKITRHNTASIGTRYIIQFKAVSTTHTIKFTNWGHICGACTELVLDDVRLYTTQYLPAPFPSCISEGINEIKHNAITVFPNPVTNQLTVNTGNNAPSELIIYDITSRKVMQQTFTNTITVNTEPLAKGIYIYQVTTAQETVKGKVVKE